MSRAAGLYSAFDGVCLVDALRTPWVDLGGALAQVSPIDLGIAAARGDLRRRADCLRHRRACDSARSERQRASAP